MVPQNKFKINDKLTTVTLKNFTNQKLGGIIMNKFLNKYELQQELERYLNTITSKSKGKQYVCPICGSGKGVHKTGALSVKVDKNGVPRATCFACHELYNSDIFETVGKVENISSFPEQYAKVAEMFGYKTVNSSVYNSVNKSGYKSAPEMSSTSSPVKEKEESNPEDFGKFLRVAHENVNETDYLKSRLIAENIINDFNLGYVEGWKHPSSPNMKPKNGVVIPISKYSYVFRDIETANSDFRYFKIKSRNTSEDKYFNFKALTESTIDPVWITEGEIDALTILSAGQSAVALGSIANVHDFADCCKDLDIKVPVIIFLDSDAKGQKAAKELKKELLKINEYRKKRGLNLIPLNVNNYSTLREVTINDKAYDVKGKDPNEVAKNLKKIQEPLWVLYFLRYSYDVRENAKNFMENEKLGSSNSTGNIDGSTDKLQQSSNVRPATSINNENAQPATSNANSQPVQPIAQSASTKQYNLHINKYLAEQEADILHILRSNKKSLLVAPMGTGKTRMIEKINNDVANIVTVIVNPSVAQLKQMEKTYDIPAVYGGFTYNNENIVCVTPESLSKKVIARLRRPFILVVDEAHEMYSSYNFRKSFEDIKQVEQSAQNTIYMTATPDILTEAEHFDAIVKVAQKSEPIQVEIMEVDKLGTSQVTSILREMLDKYELVAFHNDNKKENATITGILNTNFSIKVQQDKYFQENLLGIQPQYREIEKSTAVAVNAETKDSKVFTEIINYNKIDADVKLFCTTSCIQAGLNIDNDRETAIVYVCNNQSFKLVNFLQAIGRYRNRNNIQKVVLLKLKKDEQNRQDVQFQNFETIYENLKDLSERMLAIANDMLQNYKLHTLDKNIAENIQYSYDKASNSYYINYHGLKAKALEIYNRSFMYYPERLKIALEDNTAIPVKVEITEYSSKNDDETQDKIKEIKKINKAIFEETVEQIVKCSDEQITEILEYTVDQRKADNKELVELMENYHNFASTSFKNVLKETSEVLEIKPAEALRYIHDARNLQEVKCELIKIKAKKVNSEIKEKGMNLVKRGFKGYSKVIKKITLIRGMLKEVENKRGAITQQLKQMIADQARKLKLYKRNVESAKILQDIETLINYIYKITTDKRISSINY